jgi:hypothetical protein
VPLFGAAMLQPMTKRVSRNIFFESHPEMGARCCPISCGNGHGANARTFGRQGRPLTCKASCSFKRTGKDVKITVLASGVNEVASRQLQTNRALCVRVFT